MVQNEALYPTLPREPMLAIARTSLSELQRQTHTLASSQGSLKRKP
jgi:hypothetical protein